jgi:hypothetical protein
MITINNILSIEHRDALKNIINGEIKDNLCTTVPLYQSFDNMHEKYKNDVSINNLSIKALKEAELATNQKLDIFRLWFNISKKDSNYQFHNHKNAYTTGVYFLENCENNGTVFKVGNSNLQLMCKDDSIIIFNPDFLHSIPEWNGKNRYSVAIDFKLKT